MKNISSESFYTINKKGLEMLLSGMDFDMIHAHDNKGRVIYNKNEIVDFIKDLKIDIGFIIIEDRIDPNKVVRNALYIRSSVVDLKENSIIIFDTKENVKKLLKEPLILPVNNYILEGKERVEVTFLKEDIFIVRIDYGVGSTQILVPDCRNSEEVMKKIFPNKKITSRYITYAKEMI